jgi:leucyl aminopeptidase (aminopeptidase T)
MLNYHYSWSAVLGMDTFEGTYDKSLVRGARAAAEEILALKKGERVLIISNPAKEVTEMSMALFDSALEKKASPSLIFQKTKGQFDFAEEEVIKAISASPEVVLSISEDKLGKDRFGMKHGYKGKHRYDHIFTKLYEEKHIRGFWSPGITNDMFRRTVPIDYSQLRSDCKRVIKMMSSGVSARVTAPGGTDLVIGTRGRKPFADDGDFRKRGQAGNVPSGEVYISPELGTATGTIAFDGSIVLHEGEIVIKKPIMAEIRNGFITSITGGSEARKLEESVRLGERKAREGGKDGTIRPEKVASYSKNARSIGELGIGLNRKAKIVANMLEDEKVYGTCHFAVGSNYDNDAEALIHLDGIVKRPDIMIIDRWGKEKLMMENGRLAWD